MTGCVIFDFDGIIADTEPLHWRAIQQVLAPDGLAFSWEAYVAEFIGYDDRDAFRAAFRGVGRELTADDLDRLIREKAAAFVALAGAGDHVLYRGAADLVRGCAEAGWRMAICSGALRQEIETILDGSGLLERFDVVVTADDVRVSKPDPESYHRAVEALGVRPDQAVVIEDTPAGIAAARGAGLRVVGVTTTHSEAALADADRIVPAIAELTPSVLASILDAGG